MSYESLVGVDKSLIFRETFNSAFDVANNRYAKGTVSATGVKFESGAAKFDGNSGKITYGSLLKLSIFSIRIKINITNPNSIQVLFSQQGIISPKVTVCYFNNTSNLLIFSSGSLSVSANIDIYKNKPAEYLFISTGSNLLLYVNGILLNTSSGGTVQIAEKVPFIIGWNTGSQFVRGSIDLFEIYNKALSASEVKVLYQQRLYITPSELPLLLDFDSTRGVIEDRTGKNSLTPTNISIQQIGKVKSAYFNGASSNITSVKTFIIPCVISIWEQNLGAPNGARNLISLTPNDSYIYSEGTFQFGISISDGLGHTQTINQGVNQNKKFNNLVVIITATRCYFYYNSVLLTSIGTVISTTTTFTGFTIGQRSTQRWKGYIPKIQIFQGVPSNSNQFAAQLYNSQKGMFL